MDRKAIKTEYKGVVFDSKSEAVFARVLDLAGNHWFYHPETDDSHEWDMLVFANQTIERCWSSHGEYKTPSEFFRTMNSCPNVLVEYKPSMPTATYINNLREGWHNSPYASEIDAVVVWGSPWKDQYDPYKIIAIGHQRVSDCNVLQQFALDQLFDINSFHIASAMSYRFDLENSI